MGLAFLSCLQAHYPEDFYTIAIFSKLPTDMQVQVTDLSAEIQ